MDIETLSLFEHEDWSKIYKDLIQYAQFKLQKLQWNLGNQSSKEDVVNDSIESLLDGSRKWDPARVDLPCFLRGVIKSKVSHMASSWYQRKCVSLYELIPSDLNDDEEIYDYLDLDQFFESKDPSPESILLEKEREEIAHNILNKIRDSIGDDFELNSIMDCYSHGIYKASEISSETNIPIARIYELNRKLKRISGELE